jgi:hypothetical protein
LKYGDDTVDCNNNDFVARFIAAATDLGLKLEVQTVPKGEPLPYLGRYFVDPLTSVDSFQDPMRTISKLHLSANRSVEPSQAAANKAHGYYTTDAKTPIIGTWSKRVIEITGLKPKGLRSDEKYRMSNAWPQRSRENISEAMCKVLGIERGELELLDTIVNNITALDQFGPILETEIQVKIPAVVSGLVVEPEPRIHDTHHVAPKQERTHSELHDLGLAIPSGSKPPSSTTHRKTARIRRQVQEVGARPLRGCAQPVRTMSERDRGSVRRDNRLHREGGKGSTGSKGKRPS